ATGRIPGNPTLPDEWSHSWAITVAQPGSRMPPVERKRSKVYRNPLRVQHPGSPARQPDYSSSSPL
ncbi:MAG: hypothetical protein VX768_15700, partial [Planctomycetota bacterium]|nr:hypothetical protein [Planctomycetota bacterium]